ncbi:hypothetical protein [Actinophytocola oryzae]|uniref:Uncharacterized protein n=1 Tax=Actinophytocola oryzae TaxID=502181 RepID=A0A4R7UVB8_9PSEU|nr:hypothetical protein [Actinophytocola oryzae]TDV39984.1 hypothetical protein CLV71_1241 [Actinophytocola oryzae]
MNEGSPISEEDVRGGLRDAVADEPALDFDPDALVATARAQVKRRRSFVGAGLATAAVVVAAVAIPVALGRVGTTQVGQQPPATSTSARPSTTASTQWPPSEVSTVDHSEADLRERSQEMATHLRAAVPAAIGNASEFEYGQFGGEAAGDFYDGQNYVDAPVTFTIDDVRYSIFLTVWAPGAPQVSPDTVCGTGYTYCKPGGVREGGQLVVRAEDLGEEVITTVYHFRKSGAVVQVAAYNYDMTGNSLPKYMPDTPVTIDQLTALATDPELGL